MFPHNAAMLATSPVSREHTPHAKSQADQRPPCGPRMGPCLRRPYQRGVKADCQDAVGSQRARDASPSREGRGAAESADERGESAGWGDEKNRGPGRIPVGEHDKKGAGAEAPRFRRAQINGSAAVGKNDPKDGYWDSAK